MKSMQMEIEIPGLLQYCDIVMGKYMVSGTNSPILKTRARFLEYS